MKRLDEAFAADNNDHQCLAFDVKKCKVLDYLSPSVTGHFSSTTLKPHSKVQSAFSGEGISAKEIAELVGVKIYSELEDKPKSFRVWLKPELSDEEAMHDPEPAKERLKEAYEFLRFWKWLVVQDENKQQKITLLNVARDFFLDEELEQYKEWSHWPSICLHCWRRGSKEHWMSARTMSSSKGMYTT
jgi:hypothetical protein